jgi:hypothetical protein
MPEPGRLISRSQQHQKKRAIGLVSSGDPAAFRSLHDGTVIGLAKPPSTGPASFSQADFKKRKLLQHRYRLSLLRGTGSNVHEKGFERPNN